MYSVNHCLEKECRMTTKDGFYEDDELLKMMVYIHGRGKENQPYKHQMESEILYH